MTPAVVVLASLAAAPDPGLDSLLGGDAAHRLRLELAARARRWAAAVSPDIAFEATSPMMAGAALRGHQGAVVLVAGDVPGLDAALATDALADLAAGAEAIWAPTSDGTPYLVAYPRVDPELLALVDEGFEAWALAGAARGDGGLGMLRSERRLVTVADARALAADPAAPDDLLAHLRHAVPVRRERPRSGEQPG